VAGDFRTNQQDPELERRGAENRPGREYWAVVAPRVVVAMMPYLAMLQLDNAAQRDAEAGGPHSGARSPPCLRRAAHD